MKLNALRPTFVRNRERLNGCEIGETIRSKDCDRGRSIERRQVRFQATTSFSLTAPCKIDPFTRYSTISLFVLFFSFPLPRPFFPLFFFPSDVRSSSVQLARARLTHPRMSRVSTRGNYLVSRLPSRVGTTNGKRAPVPETSAELDTNRFQLSSRINERVMLFRTNGRTNVNKNLHSFSFFHA